MATLNHLNPIYAMKLNQKRKLRRLWKFTLDLYVLWNDKLIFDLSTSVWA